jgi:hypothetical protein
MTDSASMYTKPQYQYRHHVDEVSAQRGNSHAHQWGIRLLNIPSHIITGEN